jgi:gliding motility-associated-like protein
VPEAFSPNGDGSNDKLQFFAVGISSFTVFRIFNRWGQLLFESFDENNYWDGTFNGVLQHIDSYVWIAEAIGTDGKQLKRRGQSILIR